MDNFLLTIRKDLTVNMLTDMVNNHIETDDDLDLFLKKIQEFCQLMIEKYESD